jgi:hypothetical protein
MNIHELTTQGRGEQLGPLTVKKMFDMKPGDKSLFLIASDPTGESAIKIWGASPNHGLTQGSVFSLAASGPKGSLQNREYNEKWSINASDCLIKLGGEVPVTPTQSTSQPAQPTQTQAYSGASGDKLPLVMKRCAEATATYVDELVINKGFTRDEAIMLAQNAPSWHSLWWFGEKGLS